DDDRSNRFGKLVLERRAARCIDPGDAGNLRRRLRDGIDIVARDQRMDLTEFGSGCHGRERRVLDGFAAMFDQDQNTHFAIPKFLSFSTSSSTLPTFI